MRPTPPAPKSASSLQRCSEAIRWPRVVEMGLAFVLGAVTLLLIQYGWRRMGDHGQPSMPIEVVVYRLDLNQADRGELAQLPGIGPALADRIVAYREEHGPYSSVEALRGVKGIGPAILERVRPRLQISFNEPAAPAAPAPPRTSGSRKAPAAQSVNVNSASREELMTLPGVGPVLADRILADRGANGPFRSVSDLKRVKGIKDKVLEKLLPYVTVDNNSSLAGRDESSER
jgi:competence protein ComEA